MTHFSAALVIAVTLSSSCCPCKRTLASADPAPVVTTPAPTHAPLPLPAQRARARQFVSDVCVGAEFFGTENIVKRWTHPIRISVVAGRSSALPDLKEVVAQLNSAFAGTSMRVDLAADGDRTADLWIHVAPFSTFDAIATANGFRYAPGNWGYAYAFWDGERKLTKAHVLLASDKLRGAQLRHFTFEEVTHAMGPIGDSPVFPDSVLYQSGSQNGDASRLSPHDKQMLHLLYAHASPGFDKAQLEAVFDIHWQ